MIIAVDFDGTIVEHKYPSIGREKPGAIDTLKQLAREGNLLILWTVRDGERLEEAIEFCRGRGLEFYAVNSNTPQNVPIYGSRPATGKISADVYIDDRNLGGLPDWDEIYTQVTGLRQQWRESRKKGFWAKLFGK